ncbi:MAG TPA: SagB/ThcOx family dehydrogenase [Candidatus Nitrosotalea sp.]|nr:SagB/ThcOx family dehydrogenase [Candidatus Nitrosotalea sp.]
MKNYEIDAAWEYHNGTKHPNGILLDMSHTYHPANRPIPYKIYKNKQQIKITVDKQPSRATTLDAISHNIQHENIRLVPDLGLLSKILYFSGGITKTLKFSPPLGEVDFRAASCTGALYHIEMYVVCTDVSGLESGVYYFDPKNLALVMLRKGDYRKILSNATANEPFVSSSPVTLVFTDVFSRNSIKYQAREYRHAFWDCGTILSNSLAITSAHNLPSKLILGFVDSEINQLLGLDGKNEAALALLSLGHVEQDYPSPPPLDKITDKTEHSLEFSAITNMHHSSSLTERDEVSTWRKKIDNKMLQPSKNAIKLADSVITDDSLEQTIIRRGSTRKFSHDSISREQLSTILQSSTRGIISDFEENETINDIYVIVNAVDGIEQGAYFYNKENNSLEILHKGDFRNMSGHLGLDQSLPYDASVTIFFMVDLEKVLEYFGNRGYRVAQIDASIIAGKIYLASYAQDIGATGLTFYDDEVTEFFSPHAENKSVMFMLAVGKKAKKSTTG